MRALHGRTVLTSGKLLHYAPGTHLDDAYAGARRTYKPASFGNPMMLLPRANTRARSQSIAQPRRQPPPAEIAEESKTQVRCTERAAGEGRKLGQTSKRRAYKRGTRRHRERDGWMDGGERERMHERMTRQSPSEFTYLDDFALAAAAASPEPTMEREGQRERGEGFSFHSADRSDAVPGPQAQSTRMSGQRGSFAALKSLLSF